MLHFSEVKSAIVKGMKKYAHLGENTFIVRNIYGRISIFIVSALTSIDINGIEKEMEAILGPWFDGIEVITDDSYLLPELKKTAEPLGKNLFFVERHVTRLNWFNEVKDNKPILGEKKTKIVTFYSFKGGLGRTTLLVLTALWLVRLGKKVVLVDFDLEAPGLATILASENEMSCYGVLDFLIESQVYKKSQETINIDEYIFSVVKKELIGSKGGALYVIPAFKLTQDNPEVYMEQISRVDFGMPIYQTEDSPVKNLLEQISSRFTPDFILLDARTGINDVGGLTLSKFSDLAVLLFYGNEQNMAGMRLVLPRVMATNTSFYLVNGPVPITDEDQKAEKEYFIENSYRIFLENKYYEKDSLPDMYQEDADHFPIDIYYNPLASLLNSTTRLQRLLEHDGEQNCYQQLANLLISEFQQVEGRSLLKAILDENQRTNLLNAIAEVIPSETAAAEIEFRTQDELRKRFYPRQDHRFIFETDKFLVLGQKGSGKTALFSVLAHPTYAKELAKYLDVTYELFEGTGWVTGFKHDREYPSSANFHSLENSTTVIRSFWRCLAVRSILNSFDNSWTWASENVYQLKNCSFTDMQSLCKDNQLDAHIEEFFDKLQHNLQTENKRIILIYDALDILMPNYRGKIISSLISLWFEYLNRYQNIRAKIFLREDIYVKEVGEGLDDKVKLKNYMTKLTWEYDSLLAMIWKRVAENSTEMAHFLEEILQPLGYTLSYQNDVLGYIPRERSDLNKVLIKRIAGEKMGKGNKAGTYKWILNHLADTKGNIVPRTMLALFSYAAKRELKYGGSKMEDNTLISPTNFQRVMNQVSEDRVSDLLQEYQEYKNVLTKLYNYQKEFPVNEVDLKDALHKCGVRKDNVESTINHLIAIGVLKSYQPKLSDPIRYHIPDIYLLGMGLSRRGPGYYKDFNK